MESQDFMTLICYYTLIQGFCWILVMTDASDSPQSNMAKSFDF